MADAEEVLQDTLVQFLKTAPVFLNKAHEKAWLLRTAINKSKNYLRSGWVKRTVSLDDTVSNELSDSDEITAKEENEVMEAVLSLPDKYRTPIHLFYYNGYSINEIAKIINKKPATVGTLLARGRSKLKTLMIGGFDDEQVD